MAGDGLSVFDSLARLSALHVNQLFVGTSGGWTCRAVMQSLPPLARHVVLRLLCSRQPVPDTVVESWVHPQHAPALAAALASLHALRVLERPTQEADGGGAAAEAEGSVHQQRPAKRRRAGAVMFALNAGFRDSLRASMVTADGVPWRNQHKLKPDKRPPSLPDIDRWMRAKWDKVLYFMVGSPKAADLPVTTQDFLLKTQLMVTVASEDAGALDLKISSRGYEFLLQNIQVQMWRFVHEIIAGLDDDKKVEALAFLFQLSFCRAGQDYPVEALTDVLKQKKGGLLDEFVSFGLIYRRLVSKDGKSKPSSRFYPTTVACNLIFGHPDADTQPAGASGRGGGATKQPGVPASINLGHFHVIVQTNFQIVAYTTSELHFRMVGLFAELTTVLPNAIVASITRTAFLAALEDGITAGQIINFLETNAHPKARERTEVIPGTVREQFVLWEQEKNRVHYDDAVLYQFEGRLGPERFAELAQVAQERCALLWSEPGSELLVVKPPPRGTTDWIADHARQLQQRGAAAAAGSGW